MMQVMTTAATTCAFHPKVETALSCTHCGRPACIDCLTPVAVGQHCVGCTKGRPAAGESGETAYRVKAAVIGIDEQQRLRRPSAMFYVVVVSFLAACIVGAVLEPAEAGGTTTPARVAAVFVVLTGAVVGLMVHEWAHAIVAYFGGDRSVVEKGYLTMDVRHYSHPLLSIGMPILFLMLGGLPLPGGAVWINHAHLRSKWWESAVSIAGPASNVIFALLLYGLTATPLLGDHWALIGALQFLAFIQIGLVVLNLLPIPGLDGFGVIEPHLPDGLRAALLPLRQVSFVLLLFFIMSPASDFIWDIANGVEDWLGVDGWFSAYGEQLASPRLYGQ